MKINRRKMKKGFLAILIPTLLSSCSYTSNSKAESTDSKNASTLPLHPDTLAFKITEANNIVFSAVLDNADTLDLYFDTGGSEIVLKHSTIREKTTLLNGRNKKYNEENYMPLKGLYSLSLNNLKWDSLTIYPVELMPKEADGHFGWNLFEDKIVELDYEKKLMIVHSTFSGDLADYSKSEIEYINTLFCINGSIQVGDHKYPNRYLFDLGFQRAIVLDKNLRFKSNFPNNLPVIKESVLRNSEGTEFINRVVEVENICFGKSCISHVPVQLLSTSNPARFETHILGGELLKRFNTILDFQNGFIYMKPNSLTTLPYKDAS